MKKNTMMRLASVLLVAVLLTTCTISGTFAKYTTTDTGSDVARVAKWGVTIEIAEDLGFFADNYDFDTDVTNTTIENTFAVNTESGNLVAPGTTGSVEFSIVGTPEVAVDVKIEMTVTKDVIIPDGTDIGNSNIFADEDYEENVLSGDYTPVVFTLINKTTGQTIATGTLTAIEAGLEALSEQYDANEVLDTTYELSWVWDFEGTTTNNEADTYLGNVAAGKIDNVPEGVSTDINFTFTITATQID